MSAIKADPCFFLCCAESVGGDSAEANCACATLSAMRDVARTTAFRFARELVGLWYMNAPRLPELVYSMVQAEVASRPPNCPTKYITTSGVAALIATPSGLSLAARVAVVRRGYMIISGVDASGHGYAHVTYTIDAITGSIGVPKELIEYARGIAAVRGEKCECRIGSNTPPIVFKEIEVLGKPSHFGRTRDFIAVVERTVGKPVKELVAALASPPSTPILLSTVTRFTVGLRRCETRLIAQYEGIILRAAIGGCEDPVVEKVKVKRI